MAYRGGGYGSNYRRPYDDSGEDPLAAAIYNALAGFETVQGWKRQKADRDIELAEMERRKQMEEEDRAFRREQFEYGKSQDAVAAQERQDARRENFLVRTGDRGLTFTGNPNMPFLKTGPTKREQDLTLEASVQERLERPDLVAAALELGISDAETLDTPRLRAKLATAQDAAKRTAGTKDYEERKRIDARYVDPAVAENRQLITESREQIAEQRRATARRQQAERYVEAHGGQPAQAWSQFIKEHPDEANADPRGLWLEFRAAGQRYQDRRNPPRGQSGVDRIVSQALGEEEPAAAGPTPATGGTPASGRPATDDDILAAVRAVGNDEAAVRKWLIDRGINPDG